MGFRFRKSVGKGPLRLNISKSGIGASVGVKGCRFTKTSNGRTRSTFSIPGTGISHVTETGKKKGFAPSTSTTTTLSTKILRLLFRVIGIFTIIFSLLICFILPIVGVIGIALGALEVFATRKKKQSAPTAENENLES